MVQTKEERKAYLKEYSKVYDKSKKGKMIRTISKWKQQGLLCDSPEDYLTIYYHYLCSTNCEKCNKEFDNTKHNDKHMDHNHSTGQYRNILCHYCNVNDNSRNTSGTPNIGWDKSRKKWVYQRKINGKCHMKRFNTKEEAIAYKIEYEKENIYN